MVGLRLSGSGADTRCREAVEGSTPSVGWRPGAAPKPQPRPTMKKNYILDTNVLLHDPHAFYKFEDNDVILPIYVIEEIDQFKREPNERGRNARTVSRLLDGLREKNGSLSEGVSLGEEGTLRVHVPLKRPELAIALKYYAGRPVIERLERVSKPGLRVYKGRDDIPRVMNGLGVAILSTSRGVMTDRKARTDGVGGEVLCIVA